MTEWIGFVEEHLAGTDDIRASGAVGYVTGRFTHLMETLLRQCRNSSLVGTGTWNAFILLFVSAPDPVNGYWLLYLCS